MDMANVIGLIILLGTAVTVAFFRLSAVIWTTSVGVALLLVTLLADFPLIALLFFWLIYLLAAGFANLTAWRREFLIKPITQTLRKQMPTISETEREAISAGDTWWEKELFCGSPDWIKLLSIPKPTLSSEEQQFLDHQVDHLCGLLNDWEIVNRDNNLPPAVWDYLKQEKFFGMAIPKEYGGLGFSALGHSTVVTKIATRSISAAVTTMVPNSLGPAELLLHYGTDEQRKHYLPRLAMGAEIPCFALTAPDAGSDAGAIPDSGTVCRGLYEGQEVLGIRLSWDKRYITLAPIATVLGVAFHLYDPDHLLGDKEELGITLCLIPTSHPGVEIGHRHYPMYLSFLNGPTRGKDVFIPLDWIIGGTKMAGQGWRMLMECLSIGRSISLPALSTASAKLSYRITGAYSKVRRQFNTSIAAFEGVEEALAQIAGCTYLIESARIMTAGAVDQKINPAIVSAIAKYQMTEMARKVVSDAMDIHAGHMIQAGPRNLLLNIYIGLPISITVEGANILTRNLIIFGQGAIRCHPYILKEVELISAAQPDIAALDQTLMAHIGFFISNLAKNFVYSFTGGVFISTPIKNKRVRKYVKQLTRMSSALALLADTSLIVLGGSLKRRERLSARLGDILSQLYLGSATLKYYYDNNQAETDVDYVCWALQSCLYNIQIACDNFLENFPSKIDSLLLKFIIFPFGPAYYPPKDKLDHKIVTAMLSPSEFRDRLTKYCYVSKKPDDLSYRLDAALVQVDKIDPVWKKLHKAVQSGAIPHQYNFNQRLEAAVHDKILTADEAQLMKDYEALRSEIIKVNEFSFDLNTVIA